MNDDQLRVLGRFIDTLVLNVMPTDTAFRVEKRRVAEALREEFTLLKERVHEEEEEVETRFTFQNLPLKMKAKGGEGFNWILYNSKLTLAVNRGSKMTLLAQVRCSSEYLWSVRDLGKVLAEVHQFLISIFGEWIALQVSACDLTVDVFGLDLSSEQQVKEHFVSRAQLDDERPLSSPDEDDGMLDGPDGIKRRWRRITGLPFGSRSAPLSALIYDKTHEIKYKSKDKEWFWDLWQHEAEKQGFCLLPSAQIWRIELRFKRQALNEMKQEGVFHGIDDAYDLEERIPGLWAYAVGHADGGADGLPDGWLRYVLPTTDKNRSRWPVHPAWRVIQAAFAPEALPESDYEREKREQEELLQEVDVYLEENPLSPSISAPDRLVSSPVARPAPAPAAALPALTDDFDLRPFIRRRKYTVNKDRMVAQITGCAETFEAWQTMKGNQPGESVDLSITFHALHEEAVLYIERKKRDYSQQVQKKRVRYSIEKTVA